MGVYKLVDDRRNSLLKWVKFRFLMNSLFAYSDTSFCLSHRVAGGVNYCWRVIKTLSFRVAMLALVLVGVIAARALQRAFA